MMLWYLQASASSKSKAPLFCIPVRNVTRRINAVKYLVATNLVESRFSGVRYSGLANYIIWFSGHDFVELDLVKSYLVNSIQWNSIEWTWFCGNVWLESGTASRGEFNAWPCWVRMSMTVSVTKKIGFLSWEETRLYNFCVLSYLTTFDSLIWHTKTHKLASYRRSSE